MGTMMKGNKEGGKEVIANFEIRLHRVDGGEMGPFQAESEIFLSLSKSIWPFFTDF